MLAVNADGQVQPPSGGQTEAINECKFCLSEFGSDPVEALVCGHVFHTDCIHKWMDVSGKSKAESCPYKCHLTWVQVPTHDDTQMMDVEEDQQGGDTNIEDDQQAQSEDDELRLSSVIL